MKIHLQSRNRSAGRGFTLVELLVVITIIIALAAVVMTVTRKVKEKAQASKHLSDLRQSGAMLLGVASEKNGRCSYFAGGAGNYEFCAYFILSNALDLKAAKPYSEPLVELMHWDFEKLPPALPHWNCRAVNFQTVIYPDGTQTKWTQESIKDSQDRSGNVMSISLASVARPESYPLLIDSSTSAGSEIFRINEGNGDCVGLRESGGKAGAFMFDGSARLMDKKDLKNAGFKKAYDNSTKPPKSVTL
ncbi:MAG: type II secretion system protein [Luteolibacter sp.]